MLGVTDIQQCFGRFITAESNHTLIPSQFDRGKNIVGFILRRAVPRSRLLRVVHMLSAAALTDPAEFYNNFGPSTSRSSAVSYLHFFITFSAQLPFSVELAAQTLHWFGYLAPNKIAMLKYFLPFGSSKCCSFGQSLLKIFISENSHFWRQSYLNTGTSVLKAVTSEDSHFWSHLPFPQIFTSKESHFWRQSFLKTTGTSVLTQ